MCLSCDANAYADVKNNRGRTVPQYLASHSDELENEVHVVEAFLGRGIDVDAIDKRLQETGYDAVWHCTTMAEHSANLSDSR